MKNNILAILMMVSIMGFSQETNTVNDYWKLGVTSNLSFYSSFNNGNSVNYTESGVRVFDVGLVYNFYQFSNNRLRFEVRKPFGYWMERSYTFRGFDIPRDADFSVEEDLKILNNQFKVALVYERLFPTNKNIAFSAGAGVEILYFPSFKETSSFSISDDTGELMQRMETKGDRVKDLNLGLKGELGVYLMSNFGMFHLYTNGLLGFNNYQETTLNTMNLVVSPDSESQHGIKGHYVGFGLRFYPKKKMKKE